MNRRVRTARVLHHVVSPSSMISRHEAMGGRLALGLDRFTSFCACHFKVSNMPADRNLSSSPPTSKRIKTSTATSAPPHLLAQQQIHPFHRVPTFEGIPIPTAPIPQQQPQQAQASSSRKRPPSPTPGSSTMMATPMNPAGGVIEGDPSALSTPVEPPPKKKGRTNTPWTAEEEQRLKAMRDTGRSWSEIAKVPAQPGFWL